MIFADRNLVPEEQEGELSDDDIDDSDDNYEDEEEFDHYNDIAGVDKFPNVTHIAGVEHHQESQKKNAFYDEEIAGVHGKIVEIHENNDGNAAAHAQKSGKEEKVDADIDEQLADTQDEPEALGQVEGNMYARYGKHSSCYHICFDKLG